MIRITLALLALLASPAMAQDIAQDLAQDRAQDQAHEGHGDHAPPEHGTAADTSGAASPGPLMEMPPPPEAGSGPPRAADAIWGAEAMHAARHREHTAHGDFPVLWLQADRLEVQLRDAASGVLWDVQGYYGGPTSRFLFKSEGEGAFGERVEDAEVQRVWWRAIGAYWDWQAGVREDLGGTATTYGAVGLQGLAP